MRRSQNLPLPSRIYHPPFQQLYVILPISTPPPLSEYTPPLFQQLYAINSSLPEYNPFFNKFICATHPEYTLLSQNIPLFSTTIILCDAPRICPSLPEYTSRLFNNYMRPFQNLPLHPRIDPSLQQP